MTSGSTGQCPPGEPAGQQGGMPACAQWSQNTAGWCVPGCHHQECQAAPLWGGSFAGCVSCTSKPLALRGSRVQCSFPTCASSCSGSSPFIMATVRTEWLPAASPPGGRQAPGPRGDFPSLAPAVPDRPPHRLAHTRPAAALLLSGPRSLFYSQGLCVYIFKKQRENGWLSSLCLAHFT